MENLAFLQDLTNESVAHRHPPPYRRWRSHDDVERKPSANAATDSSRLFSRCPAVSHHDEEIDVRVSPRLSGSIGTEHDDTIRRKLPDELVHVIFNLLSRYHQPRSTMRGLSEQQVVQG
jgi:hypothetical protein